MLNELQSKAKNKAKQYFLSQTQASFATIGGTINSFSVDKNIVGIGIGPKFVGNSIESQEAIKIYVRIKIPKNDLSSHELIPPEFEGFPTDVIEIGDVTAFPTLTGNRQKKNRPTSCGVSVGHPLITAGTLGCLVEKNGKTYILSNNHVLANSNLAAINDKIIQQGSIDGGFSPGENIATLSDFKQLDFTGAANDIDAAIAKLDNVTDVDKDVIDIGVVKKKTKNAALYQSVRKHGRTTGHTIGVVNDLSVDIWVNYGGNRAWFENQIAIIGVGGKDFSQGGDSGSLIVDAVSLNPVGLLFAGGNGITFANRIDDVLNHFGVSIIGK
jgi:hypothetical protein